MKKGKFCLPLSGLGQQMIKLFNKSKPNGEAIKRIKAAFSEHFAVLETTTLSVVELNCHEPGCPSTETVVTAHNHDGSIKSWRIGKPIDEIEEQDILCLNDQNA